MSVETIISVAVIVIIVFCVATLVYRRIPKKLKVDEFTHDWRELQALCKDKATWPDAITKADVLLNKALKRRKYKGKSMGERMVSAQHTFTNNDDLWFAHNFYKKVLADPAMKLKDIDVKDALVGFRQALKDLGAFDDGKDKDVPKNEETSS